MSAAIARQRGEGKSMKQPVMAAVIAAALVISSSSGIAHADAADDQFLGAVTNGSVQGPPDQLIGLARQLCAAADLPRIALGGVPPMAAAYMDIRGQLAAMGNSRDQQGNFARAANSAYCPDKQIM
jgi:hypothetical protein